MSNKNVILWIVETLSEKDTELIPERTALKPPEHPKAPHAGVEPLFSPTKWESNLHSDHIQTCVHITSEDDLGGKPEPSAYWLLNPHYAS